MVSIWAAVNSLQPRLLDVEKYPFIYPPEEGISTNTTHSANLASWNYSGITYYEPRFGERQSPICTSCSNTLVLTCSAALVHWIPDTRHRHRVYSPLFRLAISRVRSRYSETAAGMNGMSLTKLLSFIFDFPQCCCGVVVITLFARLLDNFLLHCYL